MNELPVEGGLLLWPWCLRDDKRQADLARVAIVRGRDSVTERPLSGVGLDGMHQGPENGVAIIVFPAVEQGDWLVVIVRSVAAATENHAQQLTTSREGSVKRVQNDSRRVEGLGRFL